MRFDTELDSNYPPIDEIVSLRARLCPTEIRSHGEETEIHIDAMMAIVYRTAEGNYFSLEKKYPLEKTVGKPLTDNCAWRAFAVPSTVTGDIAVNAYGERKVIEVDFSYDLMLIFLKNRTVTAVDDIYSVEYACDSTIAQLPISRFRRSYNTGLSVNASIERQEKEAEGVRAVLGGNISLKDIAVNYDSNRSKLSIQGVAHIDLVCENNILLETEPLFSSLSYEYPFKCEIEAQDGSENGEWLCDCSITDVRFRADSVKLYTDFEVALRIIALEHEEVPYVHSANLDHGAPIMHRNVPLTLCYPNEKETLWDIAKQYAVTCDSIRTVNNLPNDQITGKKVLLIPRNTPKRAVFSKVI